MKRFMVFKFFTLILVTSCLNTCATNIYIENHYGATIKFKKGSPNSNEPEIKVDNQERVLVGPSLATPELSIRTTGRGSSMVSYFTAINPQLTEIQTNKDNPENKDKDAIILIKPSRSYQNWNIEIHWETSDQHIKEFEKDFTEFEADFKEQEARKKAEEMKAFAEQTRLFAEEQRKIKPVAPPEDFFFTEKMLAEIMQGALGENYAEKARAINNYDYTSATQKGLPNLRIHLLKRIDETFKPTYTKEKRRKTKWIAPGLATEQELKDNIDMLYRSLQRYKAQNN